MRESGAVRTCESGEVKEFVERENSCLMNHLDHCCMYICRSTFSTFPGIR